MCVCVCVRAIITCVVAAALVCDGDCKMLPLTIFCIVASTE